MSRTTGFGNPRQKTSLAIGRRNAWIWLTLALLVVVGCSSDSVSGSADRENIATVQQRLTRDQLRVLDFESPLSDWSASQGSLGQVGPLTSGSAAVRLAHPDAGWTFVCANSLPHLGTVGSSVSVDYQLDQPTLTHGELHFVVQIPLDGYYWVDLGMISIQGKAAGVIGASIGAVGTAMSQQHLRNVLAYLDVSAMGQPEAFIHVTDGFFDGQGELADEGSRKFLQKWMDRYVKWIKLHRAAASE